MAIHRDTKRIGVLLLTSGVTVLLSLLTSAPARAQVAKGTPVKTMVNPKDSLTYVWIPPGRFQMGCSADDSECGNSERPAHPVTLTKGFWIGQTPVTQAAYKKVVGSNPSDFQGDQLPVEAVTWDDAKAYCDRVDMRLPTEAEWEYAARGGSTSARYGPLDSIAWYGANSENTTHEVGRKQANGYGLFDMLGNVWEWVADWYGPYDSASATDSKGPPNGQYRVLRGDVWDMDASGVRASARNKALPGEHFDSWHAVGIRCAGN
jgi:formylglycine-generating enzyme required for sulfatase activity